ncbi:hypothetical protein [Streptomyces sp. UNOB3_S3]|uniref:hypothetical protein n=1 Tax=Streptomyces sp. UNOB3_S3 TaxID=2871682 RepID=UPI001E60CFE9|nr:hypothetical protein [Streptomyces sp. UNOB3_S3]
MGSGATPYDGVTVRVRDVVHDVVAEVAPEELPLVAALVRFDDATVVRRLGRTGGRREPLGFGLGEVVAMAAPVVWLVLDEAGRRMADAVVDAVATRSRAVLRRVLRRPSAPVSLPAALTPEQLAQIRRRVVETALTRGLGERRAQAIADAVVARLVLPDTEGGAPDPRTPERG